MAKLHHLLYSRFYTKFLYDIGVIDFDEPFKKLFNQGMITGKNGIKMSKSKGNVVSPDDLVRDYGCDALRMYELFVGPPELDAEWDDRGIEGVARFLNRFYNLVMDSKDKDIKETKEMVKLRHKLVYDIETRFNHLPVRQPRSHRPSLLPHRTPAMLHGIRCPCRRVLSRVPRQDAV